jgi:hypothetical protein
MRHAKISNHDTAIGREQNVFWFEICVDVDKDMDMVSRGIRAKCKKKLNKT